MKKTLALIGGLAAAAVLAACSSGTTGAAVQPAAAASSVTPSSSALPTTSTPPPTTTSSSTPLPAPSSTSKVTPKPQPANAVPAANPGVPCAITTGACVDLSAKRAWLLQDGKVTYGPVPITSGRKGYPTPTGMFHVLSKEKLHLSKEFNDAPMPNSTFFAPGDAFHTGSLSEPSHGCIHMSSAASLTFFNTLQIGQAVQIVP